MKNLVKFNCNNGKNDRSQYSPLIEKNKNAILFLRFKGLLQ